MDTTPIITAEVEQPSKSATALTVVASAIAEFDRVAAGIAALKEKYAGVVYDVTTTVGMAEAKAARLAVRQPRYDIERIRKSAKAPILSLGKELDGEAARITAEIEAIESPIDEQIKNEEARKEAERQTKIDAERNRLTALQSRLAGIRNIADGASLKTADEVAYLITTLEGTAIDESFAEFLAEAKTAHAVALDSLRTIHDSRIAFEQEQERLRAERIELERQRTEQAERDRVERERIAEEEAQAKIKRDEEVARHTEQLRQQREEQTRIDTEARERREQEQRDHDERMRLQREEQDRIAEQNRIERESIEAEKERLAQAERDKQAAESVAESEPALQAVTVASSALPDVTTPPPNEVASAEEPSLDIRVEKLFDAIDSGFFTSDAFHSESACQRAEFYMGRWTRAISNIREMLAKQEAAA